VDLVSTSMAEKVAEKSRKGKHDRSLTGPPGRTRVFQRLRYGGVGREEDLRE